jgi:hypothetical protein
LLIGGDRRSNSGSLAKFTANRRASSGVSRFGRRSVRRSDMSGIGGNLLQNYFGTQSEF